LNVNITNIGEMKMKIKFLGGGQEVGRLGMLLQHKGARLLFEYGLKIMEYEVGTDGRRHKVAPKAPNRCPDIDHIFLTHCHIDHSGMVPSVVYEYNARITATPMTAVVSELLWKDTLKIARSESYDDHGQPRGAMDPSERPFPMYSEAQIEMALRSFDFMQFGDEKEVGGFEVKMHSAGHVPGASMYELRGGETTLFTGDLNTYSTKLVWGAHPVKCDNLIIESTYAGRDHPDRAQEEKRFVAKVRDVVERGGKAIIPCFAVGRTQEVMLLLKELPYSMWVDGMGKSVNRFYLDLPEYLRSEQDMRKAKRVFNEVRTDSARDRAIKEGQVIVTTGGMLDGGPVLRYIEAQKDNKNSAILIPGYLAKNSNGRMLLEDGRLDLSSSYRDKATGQVHRIERGIERLQLEYGPGPCQFDLSAHADHSELLRFIKGCDPSKIILMHGDNREALAEELQDEYDVLLPVAGQELEI
jgi:putative mRNA 3-end processing factor